MIKTIIYDWHGVLDHTTLEFILEEISKVCHVPISQVKESLKDTKKLVISGECGSDVLWKMVQDSFDMPDEKLRSLQDYSLKIELNTTLFSRLKELSKRFKLAILSDCPSDKALKIQKTVDLSIFDKTFFSCDLGLTKSNDTFFLQTLNALSTKPSESLYVDDSLTHIHKARELGMHTHLFTTTENFMKYLINF